MEDERIPAIALSSATDGNQNLKKQMGCINGIIQLFDRHHFITGQRASIHNSRRLHQGHQQGYNNMGKSSEPLKEKPRMSTESSRPSCSSSTCSTSTFSSVDCNRIAHSETLSQGQINIPENILQTIAKKERQPPLTKTMQSLDLRDIVKDSMYREARGMSIKHLDTDEIRGTAMKHIDSPRPLQKFKTGNPKAKGYERSTQALVKDREKSMQEKLALPCFSYDGKESREKLKQDMKHKELTRLSVDSKSSSLKSSACESKLNFPGQDQHMEIKSLIQPLLSNQESVSQHRSSSIVARLMGLETLQQTIPSEGRWQSRQSQDTYSPCGHSGTSSTRLPNANNERKLTASSKLPVEQVRKLQNVRKGSQPMSTPITKATSASHLSSSVYGEIEKCIKELQFKQPGTDLRALQQILEAIDKKGEKLDNQRGEYTGFKCSLEDNHSGQNSNFLMEENVQSCHKVSTINSPCMPRQSDSSNLTMKYKDNLATQTPMMEPQRRRTPEPIYRRKISAHKPEAKYCSAKSNNVKDPSGHLPLPHKKTDWRTLEAKKTLAGPHCVTLETTINSGRSFGLASAILQHNPSGIEEENYPTILLLDSHRVRRPSSKKLAVEGAKNRNHRGKAKALQSNADHLSELSSFTRGSSDQGDIASVKLKGNSSQLSQAEAAVTGLVTSSFSHVKLKEKSASIRRNNICAVENGATLLEQPSPSSVLDDTFYNEDLPSPAKRISIGSQDESSSPGEAEWTLKNSKLSAACRRSYHNCKYNQKIEKMKPADRELSFLHMEPDIIATNDNGLTCGKCNPEHRYITKILLTPGLLKESAFFSTTDHLLPSCHLINPDIFHALEQMGLMNDNMQLNKKVQTRIISDIVDEVLVRKIHSGKYTMGEHSKSPEMLLKEVYLEIDHLCSIPVCNPDSAKKAVARLLNGDILYQFDDWADCSSEFPALVLDIERQIFKDLINEVIAGEAIRVCDRPKKHCRQLFS
ncbi:protein LONGIFOLIA 1-like [Andrographis paniculata]|uniref:protein LONGIFOLIA 1-like n=1 Tax=Andrographis paniculata TaxID=175694 RepID=UPI0021E82946|nr:protein LONGIFOLIA 1-like [Andrographis paniculata]